MRRRMTEMEHLYFQWARGRAIAQKYAMQNARRARRAGTGLVASYVAIARQACRDWRQYRREMLDCRQKGI